MSNLKDQLIKLGSTYPALQEHIRPILNKISHLPEGNLYPHDESRLATKTAMSREQAHEVIRYYGRKIDQHTKQLSMQKERLEKEIQDIEKAWDRWDVKALERLGVLERRSVMELEKALDDF